MKGSVFQVKLIRTLWPTPFNVKPKHLGSFIVQLIVFLIVCAVIGWLIGVLSGIPIVGVLFAILGSLMEAYSAVGIALCILRFLNVIK